MKEGFRAQKNTGYLEAQKNSGKIEAQKMQEVLRAQTSAEDPRHTGKKGQSCDP